MIALSAFIIRSFNGSENNQVGTEGWSKYAKTAIVFGSSIGQFLGGVISYVNKSDLGTSLDNITFYSTITSLISFCIVILFVPLLNYLTRNNTQRITKGILITEDRDVFNSNYVRSGITLGVAIGAIIGAFLGPIILTGISATVAMAIGGSAFSIIFGIGLGAYGQKLSLYFEKFWGISHNTDNSWSYATSSTSYYFSCFSIILVYALCPVSTLAFYSLIASAIASLIGWFTGLFIIWLSRKIEPDETKTIAITLPWTQRLSTGTTRGMIIGAFAGLGIGLLAIGPFGLIGWMTLIAAVGGIMGGIKDVGSDHVFCTMIKKVISLLFEIHNQPKNNICLVNPTPQRNRYALFSCKEPVISQEHEFCASEPQKINLPSSACI